MSEKDNPGVLAGATGADQDAAGQHSDVFIKSEIAAPTADEASGENRTNGAAPDGSASPTPDHRTEDTAKIARLAVLPVLDYARERKRAAKALGCPVALLDRLVETARSTRSVPDASDPEDVNPDTRGRGRALEVRDIEPWPEPVNGSILLDELTQTIRRHVVLDAATADATALWIVHTHAIDAADISPRLAVTSPDKRCGKTTLLNLLTALVAGPVKTANMTVATLFRVIEAMHPTLLIDEADTFLIGADEMKGIINTGIAERGRRCCGWCLRMTDGNFGVSMSGVRSHWLRSATCRAQSRIDP
jgi:hypothetical protein